MRQLTTTAALAIGLCISVGVGAHGGEDRPVPPTFSEIDTNSDQLISRDEIQSVMQNRASERGGRSRSGRGGTGRFERADTNGDGFIDESEFAAVQAKMSERRGRYRGHGGCEDADDSA